jgi:DNA-binding NarL/FixJ family response regulator
MQPEIASKVIAHITKNKAASTGNRITAGESQVDELTDREKEILILVARGMNNNEIAKNLFISVGTVKNYISSIYDKIGIKERSKAILFAMENHYLD